MVIAALKRKPAHLFEGVVFHSLLAVSAAHNIHPLANLVFTLLDFSPKENVCFKTNKDPSTSLHISDSSEKVSIKIVYLQAREGNSGLNWGAD